MSALLEVRGLKVRYGQITALSEVGLDVGEDEIVAIIGPNGAGKTSFLSAIAGVVPVTSGTITFRGDDILSLPMEEAVRKGIALVPEGRHVLPGLTVLENLKLGATIRNDAAGIRNDLERFLDAFPILHERRDEPAGRLSGGEQQMLVIARALMSRPTLLMLDEPSLGLAPRIVEQVYDMIKATRESGVTVLVVEQNARRALAVADRTHVLNSGVIRLSGTAETLSNDPDFEVAYFGLRTVRNE
ncbi:MAG: branched-chain amino acid transport system ATP-binding protein [Rhodobacteraceae bacterium HLUCCA12]|nr:MAG: branched-chain amino acid transport system ATP-binding protein [Rhodobacteraceae bacterium HLUCCA12]